MLKRISTSVSQSSLSLSTSYMGKAGWMLEPKHKELGSQFFETYRACVLTLRNS